MPGFLCSTSERGLHYFGTLFILIGFIGVSGFMLGTALNMDITDEKTPDILTVRDFSYLTGVFLLLFAVGWLICHSTTSMSCAGDLVLLNAIGHYLVVIFIIIAGALFFGFGNQFGEDKFTDAS